GASVQLQGNIAVAGEALDIQGAGATTTSTVTSSWFAQGPGPILNGEVPGTTNTNVTGSVTSVQVDPSDPNSIYITAADGGAWHTKDGGQSWQALFDNGFDGSANFPVTTQTLFTGAIAVLPSDPRVVYMATGDATNTPNSFYGRGVFKSTNSGKTWTLLTTPVGDPPIVSAGNENPL